MFALELDRRLRAAGPGGVYIGPDGFGEGRGHPTRVSPGKAARDESVARSLWEVSEEMTGVKVVPAVPA